MLSLKPNYVTDANNKKVAVQLNLKTFEKIEEIQENYSLYKLMEESEDDEMLTLQKAQVHYKKLKKAK